MDTNVVKKITGYGDRYIQRHLISVYDKDTMNNNWWEGNKFFICRTFYQGRLDIVSEKVEKAAMSILNRCFEYKPSDELGKYLPHFSEIKKQLDQVIGKGKVGKSRAIRKAYVTINTLDDMINNILEPILVEIKKSQDKLSQEESCLILY